MNKDSEMEDLSKPIEEQKETGGNSLFERLQRQRYLIDKLMTLRDILSKAEQDDKKEEIQDT